MSVITARNQVLKSWQHMIKTLRMLFVSMALCSVFNVAGATEPNDASQLLGYWQPENDPDVIVTISQSEGRLQGHVSDHRVRPDEAIGVHTLHDFNFNAETNRWTGRVYSAKRDKSFDGSIQLENVDEFKLEVRLGFLKRTVNWQRMPGSNFHHGTPPEAQ